MGTIIKMENAIFQGIFALSEGFIIVAAFVLSLVLIETIKNKNEDTSWSMVLYFAISFAVSLAIFLPLHFTIGV